MALRTIGSRIIGTAIVAGLVAATIGSLYAPSPVHADNPGIVQPSGAPETLTLGIDDKCITGNYTVTRGDTGYGIWQRNVGDCMTYDAFKSAVEAQNNGKPIDQIEVGSTFTGLSLQTEPTVKTPSPSPEIANKAKPTPQPKSQTNGKGLCPVDISDPETSIRQTYSPSHIGLDIVGPQGTGHVCPAQKCEVIALSIAGNGAHNLELRLNDNRLMKMVLGHGNLLSGDTLAWYGVPRDRLFVPGSETPVAMPTSAGPSINLITTYGQDLHYYMSNTEENAGPVHTHVGYWTIKRIGEIWNQMNDPCAYLDCCDRFALRGQK